MKRFIPALLVLSFFTLPACDGGEKPVEETKPTDEAKPADEAEPADAAAPASGAEAASGATGATGATGASGATGATGEPATDTPETDTPKTDKPKSDKPKADLAAGKELYMKKCKNCHGETGDSDTKLGKKLEIDPLKGSRMPLSKMRKIVENGIPDTKMKAYKSKLSDEEITNVVAFAKSL